MSISQDSKDLFRVKDSSDPRNFIAHLAWNEEKAGYFQKSGSPEKDQCIAIGFLWREFEAEIIKHILETSKPRNATPLETIDMRLHRIENEITQAKDTGLRFFSVLQKALVAMQVECDSTLPESSSPYDRVRRWIRDNPEMVKKLRKE